MNRDLAVGLALGSIAGRRGGDTHNHTHIEMADPSIEKGARFLDETQAKAAERITNAILVDVPSIAARLVTYDLQRIMESGNLDHHIAFTINGKPFNIRLSTSEDEDIFKTLADKLTHELLTQLTTSTTHQLSLYRKVY